MTKDVGAAAASSGGTFERLIRTAEAHADLLATVAFVQAELQEAAWQQQPVPWHWLAQRAELLRLALEQAREL